MLDYLNKLYKKLSNQKHLVNEDITTPEETPIAVVVTQRVKKWVVIGKYTRWAERISIESLESLLWIVGVFSRQYIYAMSKTGKHPNPIFAPHYMDEERMRKALIAMTAIQNGWDFKSDPQEGSEWFDNPQPVFTPEFRERINTDDLCLNWASNLNERQLWTLLWYIGEYGSLVNSSIYWQDEEYPPPTFDVPDLCGELMQNALRVVAAIENGQTIDIQAAIKQVYGKSA